MTTLFISDLHLDAARPAVTEAFLTLLQGKAQHADALYILGDFFEVWVGDDDDAELPRQIITALKALTDSGTPVYVMRGNRDFLLGDRFSQESGCQLLSDPAVVTLYGKPVLLMHGDLLCTDDVKYMEFRAESRNEAWQQAVLARPLAQRRLLAAQLRQDSRQATTNKAEDIMDVNQGEVVKQMMTHNVSLLIHGHTHRPDVHRFTDSAEALTRIVLGDWEQFSWVLEYQPSHDYQLLKAPIAG